MRAFFAIPMPFAQRQALVAAQARLPSDSGLSWTRPEDFHLTLAFLGDVDDREFEAARLRLEQASMPRESANLCGFGAFPNLARARVLWVGVHGADESLSRLHATLRSPREGEGIDSFVPHVTIARATGSLSVDLRHLVDDAWRMDCGVLALAPIVLYESKRSSSGARYREIMRRD